MGYGFDEFDGFDDLVDKTVLKDLIDSIGIWYFMTPVLTLSTKLT